MRKLSDLSNDDYHAHEAIGSSGIKDLLKSPAHFKHWKNYQASKTPALVLGSAIHSIVLEPDLFKRDYIKAPKFAGKGAMQAKEEFMLENAQKIVLNPDQWDICFGIRESILRHSKAEALLSDGEVEHSYFWADKASTIDCKCRPDYKRKNVLIDLKSTSDASPDAFRHSINRYGYHISAAFYLDGVNHFPDHLVEHFVIIAVEKTPPYAIALYTLDEATIDVGRQQYRRALEIYASCLEEDNWPDYPDEILTMALPSYAFPQEEIYE